MEDMQNKEMVWKSTSQHCSASILFPKMHSMEPFGSFEDRKVFARVWSQHEDRRCLEETSMSKRIYALCSWYVTAATLFSRLYSLDMNLTNNTTVSLSDIVVIQSIARRKGGCKKLELLRLEKREACSRRIQSEWKARVERRRINRILLNMRHMKHVERSAAVMIQATWRCNFALQCFSRYKCNTIVLQSRCRMWIAMSRYNHAVRGEACSIIPWIQFVLGISCLMFEFYYVYSRCDIMSGYNKEILGCEDS